MIEPVEQSMLEHLASQVVFQPNDIAVEFGTFFGRSTACIAAGLSANDSFRLGGKFYAYDSFECDLEGGFYPHVVSFAEASGVAHLLERKEKKIDFLPVFMHFLANRIEQGTVYPVKSELVNSLPPEGAIGLMHIDSPKFYEELKVVMYRFFPKLRSGGFVIFQDFFYHWSASLIAACSCMIKLGYLSVVTSSASSLVCQIEKPFNLEGIYEIDLHMQRDGQVPSLIDFALNAVQGSAIDRPEQFKPRLILAKVQWLYERGHHGVACDEILRFFADGNKLNSAVLNDFLELMRSGFSMRKLYEKDHNNHAIS